eukprot:scaffold42710_cov33-Tisochrysis_lutea.AAC.2
MRRYADGARRLLPADLGGEVSERVGREESSPAGSSAAHLFADVHDERPKGDAHDGLHEPRAEEEVQLGVPGAGRAEERQRRAVVCNRSYQLGPDHASLLLAP